MSSSPASATTLSMVTETVNHWALVTEIAKKLVPQGAGSRTPLYVLCTGGVRILEPESAQLDVLGSVRAYLLDPTNDPSLLK